jgi:hypothetical protein
MNMNNWSTPIEWHFLQKYNYLAEDFRLIISSLHFRGQWPKSRDHIACSLGKGQGLKKIKYWIQIIFLYFIVCIYKLKDFYVVHVPMTYPNRNKEKIHMYYNHFWRKIMGRWKRGPLIGFRLKAWGRFSSTPLLHGVPMLVYNDGMHEDE